MIGFYRALLRLYPSAFRAEYGAELCEIFDERARETSPPRAVASAIADVVPNALAVHFDILRQDLRFMWRTMRRAPGFALTAIAIVALGIGANTAAFSLADFVLLRPLPFPDSDRLLRMWNSTDGSGPNDVSPAEYRDWKAMAKSFRALGAYSFTQQNLVGQGAPIRLTAVRVTPDLMPLVGVPPLLGSVITPANTRAEDTAVLSNDLWRNQFASDPNVVGRVVRLSGAPHTVIGVMPRGFHFPERHVDLWTPMVFTPQNYEDRTDTYIHVLGRLAPGVTSETARAEMNAIAARLEQQYPDTNKDLGIITTRLRDQIGRGQRLLVLALCGAALCILLLACANLASLLLARGVSRSRELSIRTALGAGRDRLVRQLFTESILLAVLGGAVGVLLAWTTLPFLARLVPQTLPIAETPSIDFRVLGFAAALIGLTGLAFGMVPALRKPDSTRHRMRSALVVTEVTCSIVLLITAGLLMRAIWRIQAIEPGFRYEGVMTLRTALPLPKYGPVAARERFYKQVLDGVRALPGIESAAYVTGLPMERTGGIWGMEIPGVPKSEDNSVSLRYVTPGYFATLSIPFRRGRDIDQRDAQNHRPYAAVISESAAKRHWPNQDPIGRRFKIAMEEVEVVGVVGDVKVRGLERANEPQVYVASGQVADESITGYIPQDLVIRTDLPPAQWLPSVRQLVAGADAEQPISHIRPLSEVVAGDTAPRRVQLRLLTILAIIALLIAGVGIHGLLSFAVAQRTKEIGIRRALGAQPRGVMSMILREGLRLTIAGAIIGVVVAVLVARSMNALLFGVPPADPETILAALALCLVTAVIGCIRPALRAARVQPSTALREG
ncbi:MAG TPA: ABC transporter permease [Thermoanaerobaculia bacterium]|nr:ABC transporter permease [Thermoanaerobaculia bacterium]